MIIEKFIQTYQQLDKNNLELLDDIYCENTSFIDPFNKINRLNNLKIYFAELYENISLIDFDFKDTSSINNNHYISWKMILTHPKLNQGKSFSVPGITHLKTDENDKINYHRDYFDAGKMLYEQLPLLGRLIRWLKRKI